MNTLGVGLWGSHRAIIHNIHLRIYDRKSLTALVEAMSFKVIAYRKFEKGMNQLLVCSGNS